MSNKKASLEISTPVILIITLIIAFIGIMIVPGILNIGEENVNRQGCKLSVQAREQSKLAGYPVLDSLDCETHIVEFNDNEETELYSKLSEEMFLCWNQLGEGKVDFLSDLDFGKGDNWCFICSRIDIKEKTSEELGLLDVKDFHSYLANQKIPFNPADNFYNYLYGGSVTIGQVGGIDSEIKTNEPIYVTYFADKRREDTGISSAYPVSPSFPISGCVAGAAVGGAIGNIPGAVIGCGTGMFLGVVGDPLVKRTEFVSGLYVGNAENIQEVCNQ